MLLRIARTRDCSDGSIVNIWQQKVLTKTKAHRSLLTSDKTGVNCKISTWAEYENVYVETNKGTVAIAIDMTYLQGELRILDSKRQQLNHSQPER
jgi:hypothetical protein